MLALVRGASVMPWPTVGVVMQQGYRALHLARAAGAPGEALRAAIDAEIERLFRSEEQAQMAALG